MYTRDETYELSRILRTGVRALSGSSRDLNPRGKGKERASLLPEPTSRPSEAVDRDFRGFVFLAGAMAVLAQEPFDEILVRFVHEM